MNQFYYLPPHILNKIFYLSSNYKENYDKVISNIKYNNVLDELKFHLSEPLDNNLTSYFILTRINIVNYFIKNPYDYQNKSHIILMIWNFYDKLLNKQEEYYNKYYRMTLNDIIGYLKIVL